MSSLRIAEFAINLFYFKYINLVMLHCSLITVFQVYCIVVIIFIEDLELCGQTRRKALCKVMIVTEWRVSWSMVYTPT